MTMDKVNPTYWEYIVGAGSSVLLCRAKEDAEYISSLMTNGLHQVILNIPHKLRIARYTIDVNPIFLKPESGLDGWDYLGRCLHELKLGHFCDFPTKITFHYPLEKMKTYADGTATVRVKLPYDKLLSWSDLHRVLLIAGHLGLIRNEEVKLASQREPFPMLLVPVHTTARTLSIF